MSRPLTREGIQCGQSAEPLHAFVDAGPGKSDASARAPQNQAESKELQAAADDREGGVRLPAGAEELRALMREAMHRLAVEVRVMVAGELLEDEVAELCGRRYPRQPNREATRYGRQA